MRLEYGYHLEDFNEETKIVIEESLTSTETTFQKMMRLPDDAPVRETLPGVKARLDMFRYYLDVYDAVREEIMADGKIIEFPR